MKQATLNFAKKSSSTAAGRAPVNDGANKNGAATRYTHHAPLPPPAASHISLMGGQTRAAVNTPLPGGMMAPPAPVVYAPKISRVVSAKAPMLADTRTGGASPSVTAAEAAPVPAPWLDSLSRLGPGSVNSNSASSALTRSASEGVKTLAREVEHQSSAHRSQSDPLPLPLAFHSPFSTQFLAEQLAPSHSVSTSWHFSAIVNPC